MKLINVLAEEFSMFDQFGGKASDDDRNVGTDLTTGGDDSLTGENDLDDMDGTDDDCECQCDCPCCQKNKQKDLDDGSLDFKQDDGSLDFKQDDGDVSLDLDDGDDEFDFKV